MTFSTTASVQSERAPIYLQQLCKHFGHKIEVSFTPEEGFISFPFGRCDLSAADGVLTMKNSAEDEADLDRLNNVIASHLERFAFREKPEIVWS